MIRNQHGFRPGSFCQTQSISLIDDISCAMDNHYQTDIILLDFSKTLIQCLTDVFWLSFSITKQIILYGSGSNHGSLNILKLWLLMVHCRNQFQYCQVSLKELYWALYCFYCTLMILLVLTGYLPHFTYLLMISLLSKIKSPRFDITSKRPGPVILLGFNMADEI